MSADNNLTISQKTTDTLTTDVLTKEETKQILTPFAFEIDKSLFGLPLAVPWKRGAALLVDFLLIALLAETPGELLAFVVAITFFRIGSKRRAEKLGKRRGLRKLFLRLIGAFILFVMLISTLPNFIDRYYNADSVADDGQSAVITAEKPTIEEKSTPSEEVKVVNEKLSEVVQQDDTESDSIIYQGVEWGKGVIKDLGLSFGWAAFYFTVLTAIWNGQTPGKKMLNIRVIQLDGTPLSIWDSFGRYGGYAAGLATGFMGFLQIYWEPNRQAIHDKISATIVIDVKKYQRMQEKR